MHYTCEVYVQTLIFRVAVYPWTLIKISESFKLNQGTVLAVSPTDGAVYVAWRQFATTNVPDGIIIAKSTDGGRSFSKGTSIATIQPFDQGSTPFSFRTNAYPTMAIDGSGRVYVAWSQRGVGPGGDARIMASMSSDGVNWTAPGVVDRSPERGHQIMRRSRKNSLILLVNGVPRCSFIPNT